MKIGPIGCSGQRCGKNYRAYFFWPTLYVITVYLNVTSGRTDKRTGTDSMTVHIPYRYILHRPTVATVAYTIGSRQPRQSLVKTGRTWDNAGERDGQSDKPWLAWMPGQIFKLSKNLPRQSRCFWETS